MPYSDMVVALDKQIQDVKVEYKGRIFGYKDLCLSGRNHVCPGNKHIGLLSGFFQHGVNMTYPMIKLGGV